MKWGEDVLSDGEHCAVCGKPIKGKVWGVHVIDGGNLVLHPDDEDKYVSDGGDMGTHDVGSECRKHFKDFAARPH